MCHFVSPTMVIGRRRRDLRIEHHHHHPAVASTTIKSIAFVLLILIGSATITTGQVSNYGDGLCGFPGEPDCGSANPIKPDYETRDTVTFSCQSGYILVGPHQITCRRDSTWSSETPQCQKEAAEIEKSLASDDNVNTCVEVTNSKALRLRTSPFSQHSIKAVVISFSKVTGSPNAEITVSNDGANPQNCATVQNVVLQDSNLYHNFDCVKTVTGNTLQISVKSMRAFSPVASVMVCEVGVADAFVGKRKCGSPQIPANGSILNRTEDRVTYACLRGFYVNSTAATSVCEDGVWKNHVQCKSLPLKCGFPGTPRNGYQEYADVVTGTIRYACLPSYILTGPSIRTCLLNGTWSPQSIPKCLTNVAYAKYVSHSDMSSGANKPSVDENPETCDVIGYHRSDAFKQRWWKLDFGAVMSITSVRVVQPRGQQKQLKVASFYLDTLPRTNIVCTFDRDVAAVLLCEMQSTQNARGLYIQPAVSQDNITLCEVQVINRLESVSCGTVDEPVNGKVTYKQNEAQFSCDVGGYSLSGGASVINCEDGSWKSPYPSCIVPSAWKPSPVTPARKSTPRPTSSSWPTASSGGGSGEHHEPDKDNYIVGIMGIAIGVTAASVSIIIAIVVIVCIMKRHYKKKHVRNNHECTPNCSHLNTNSTTYNGSGSGRFGVGFGGGSHGSGSQRDWDDSSIHLYETVKPEYDTLDPCIQSLVVNESYVEAAAPNRNLHPLIRPRLAPPRSNHIYDVVATEESLLDRDGRPRENGLGHRTKPKSPRDDVILGGGNLLRTDL